MRQAEAELEARMHRWAVTVGVAGLVVLGAAGLALLFLQRSQQTSTGAVLVTATVSSTLGYLVAAMQRRRATRRP
jgi:hypothetical protein